MTNTNHTRRTRTFVTRIASRGCENFGPVNYTITDVITETPAGVSVLSTTRGTCEGDRVDSTERSECPGVSFDGACTYRLRNGYSEVCS